MKILLLPQVHKGVKGFVKDKEGSPIPGAAIRVDNRRKEVFTAKDGDYWRLLLPGGYKVTAFAPGYEPVTKEITVSDGDAKELNFVLKKSDNSKDAEQQDEPNPEEDSKPETGSLFPTVNLGDTPGGGMMPTSSMDGEMPGGGDYGMVMNGVGMGSLMQTTPYGASSQGTTGPVANSADPGGSIGPDANVGAGGPLNDAELDRFAMMSPFEAESRDNTKGFFHVTTDDHEPHATFANGGGDSGDSTGSNDVIKKFDIGRPRKK